MGRLYLRPLLAILVASLFFAAGVYFLPQARLEVLDNIPVKLILFAVAFLLLVDIGIRVYEHALIHPTNRTVLRVMGPILTAGLTLSFLPFSLASFEEARLKANLDAKLRMSKVNPGAVKAEIDAQLKLSNSNAATQTARIFLPTLLLGFATAVLCIWVDGVHRLWEFMTRR